ncbi:hypothetical protein CROQUDRAFT_722973 [Cronartium quercuum f. sp. fusiforme G11]|uniref:Ribosomal protein S8 n=1 Tax=Cronartium quercuum f. sp. fusiforme G11 TaxID=708437 RepID=A0A9P6NIL2_9BASI|nr:hypothetical protein CROQUDRAFT_722973 [Cronartium quercuum f. sp. fusiforme G11]
MATRIGLPNLAHNLCSHLQNTSRRRLRHAPIPASTLHSSILNVLLSEGFVSGISRGTLEGPDPSAYVKAPVRRRILWVEHKFRDEQPVLRSAVPVSKPSLRVFMSKDELKEFIGGKRNGLRLGEICVVRSLDGKSYWEGRQSLGVIGNEPVEVVCRVSS